MRKIKSLFLSLIILPFFLSISNARTASDFNLNQTHYWLSIITAFSSDLESNFKVSPVLQKEGISLKKLHAGTDILPKISDEGRVKGILELVRKIAANEPLPYREDGQTFKNREGLLPQKPLGFYKEYTFVAPKNSPEIIMIGGVEYKVYPSYSERGAERLVIGGNEIVYYTPTHYDDFIKLEIIK